MLDFVNFCETFNEYLKFEETDRPKTWSSVLSIHPLQHHNFLAFSVDCFRFIFYCVMVLRVTPFKIDQNINKSLSIDKFQNLENERR